MPDSDAAELPTDRAFDLLGDATRRRTVAALRAADGAVALDDLVDDVVERVSDGTPGDVPSDRRERVAASLHHCHLPKLDDADVVAYDPTENRVAVTPDADELAPFLDAIETGVERVRRE
ncbi:DUF7344 domain-containing protein [Halorussus halobius]|uniref:DUF7344 domain-containing protein n=1 Tax=Halorussus halobius TaxID=1710537 RepID=UPI0010924E19|nr:hypothetical protein [Halorussus halobius]